MSPTASAAGRVLDISETLTAPGKVDLAATLARLRDLDALLRRPGDDGDAAARAFCEGPEDAPARSALRWSVAMLSKRDGDDLRAGGARARPLTHLQAATLQILVSVSGADHRSQFGHRSRDGSHLEWPTRRGLALATRRWRPDVDVPTGLLPPLLALATETDARTAPQVRMRALQLAGSLTRDARVPPRMVAGGWPTAAAKALERRPRPDFSEDESKMFVYEREAWQRVDEACAGVEPENGEEGEDDDDEDAADEDRRAGSREAGASAAAAAPASGPGPGPGPGARVLPTPPPSRPLTREAPAPEPLTWRVMPEAGERELEDGDLAASDAGSWRGQLVRISGLASRPDANGKLGYAQGVGSSEGRIAVLINPLGVQGHGEAAEMLSVKRERCSVVEGRKQPAGGGVGGSGSGGGVLCDGETVLEVPLRELRARIAAKGPTSLVEGEEIILERLSEGRKALACEDFETASKRFEDALSTSTELHDHKSLVRAHIMWLCHTARAGMGIDATSSDTSSDACLSDAYASRAMDVLEFRLDTTFRDARPGERVVPSLFEMADPEELAFFTVLCVACEDPVPELSAFLGPSLTLRLASDVFLPRLFKTDGVGAAEDWRRLDVALRVVETEWRLGAIATVWREGGVNGERGAAEVAPVPSGVVERYKAARALFLRAYYALLVKKFAPGETDDEKRAHATSWSKEMRAVAQVNPFVLSFVSSGYRDVLSD
jgi:hypothetical protein